MRVLVAGSGPTGLTAALALAHRGHEVRVVERRDNASNLSRAVGILPATMATFERLGVAAEIRSQAIVPREIRMSRAGLVLGAIDLSDLHVPGRELLLLAQDHTEAVLRAALSRAGVDIEFGAALDTLSQDADGVTATLATGETWRGDHLIGADGVHSTVRGALGIAYPGHDIEPQWSIADISASGPFDPAIAFIDIGTPETGVTVGVPFAERRIRIVAARPDALRDLPFPVVPGKIHRAAAFTIAVRQAETYVVDRVLLAGDAAHSHSPVGGRGMNLGIADAEAAAQAIHLGTLGEYSRVRHQKGRDVIAGTERARRIVTTGRPSVAIGMRIALAGLNLSHTAREKAFARLTTL